MPSARARPLPAALTPLVALGRELQAIVDDRVPLVGGCAASLALGGALLAMLALGSSADAHPPDSEFELAFEPGTLTRLGNEPEPIPHKSIHEATHASGELATNTVSDASSPSEPASEPATTPTTHDRGEVADRDRPDTNPYHEANNEVPAQGDPLGDAQGWADALADGDPWATGVMKALNGMAVPGYAGKLPAGKSFAFKLEVCKTGKVGKVLVKQSSGVAELDAAIKAELSRLTIPKPPAQLLAQMDSTCVMLKYQFVWQQGRVG